VDFYDVALVGLCVVELENFVASNLWIYLSACSVYDGYCVTHARHACDGYCDICDVLRSSRPTGANSSAAADKQVEKKRTTSDHPTPVASRSPRVLRTGHYPIRSLIHDSGG
jgi:hypothetical protein